MMTLRGLRLMLMVEKMLIGFDGGDYGALARTGRPLWVDLGVDVKTEGRVELLS